MAYLNYGNSITLLSDVYCELPVLNRPSKNKKPRKYFHLATVLMGSHEYTAYLDPLKNKVWIEEVINTTPLTLQRIEDDSIWNDLRDYMWDARLLEIGSRKEVPISESVANTLGLTNKRKLVEV